MTLRTPEPDKLYRHYKNGKVYKVLCIATDVDSGQQRVIYQAQDKQIWDRAVEEWFSSTPEGFEQRTRFEGIDELSS